jgi:hypothetical protein
VSGTGGRQIGGIHQRHGQALAPAFGQQGFQEPLVDLAQPAGTGTFPKLVEHPGIRHGLPVGQPGKAAPVPLLWQHSQQLVESMDRSQNAQQMDAIQLGRAQLLSPPPTSVAWHQIVDKAVRNIR